MIYLKYDLNDKRIRYFIQSDETQGKLIKSIDTSELAVEECPFRR